MSTLSPQSPRLIERILLIILAYIILAMLCFGCNEKGVYVKPVYLTYDVEYRSSRHISGYDLDGEKIWTYEFDTCFIVTPNSKAYGELFVNGVRYQMLCTEPGYEPSYWLCNRTAHAGDSLTYDHLGDGSIDQVEILEPK